MLAAHRLKKRSRIEILELYEPELWQATFRPYVQLSIGFDVVVVRCILVSQGVAS